MFTPAPSPQPPANSERGIALLIVVSILTVIGILGVAFAFSMFLETQASREFIATTQARYLAEAGVNDARALLDEDRLGSRVDDLTESWTHSIAGTDVDIDGDGAMDAKWYPVTDADKRVVGRYAEQIIDEGGKANLNAAQADPPTQGVGAINLTAILEAAQIPNPHDVAKTIERYRYGPDGHPGVAGVDDDNNGTIDDPGEYQSLALKGDDRRLESLEEVAGIAGLDADAVRRLAAVATVYSFDLNMSVTGKLRTNVNSATAQELVNVLIEAGVADPWQTAANVADAVDPDFEMSTVLKSVQPFTMPAGAGAGTWTWQSGPPGHYASAEPGDDRLTWTLTVPTGSYVVRARGLPGTKIGDVSINGVLKPSVDDGESLGTHTLTGTLTIEVMNREAAKTPCAFQGVELVSNAPTSGQVVRGIEAVRFNELMVDPLMTLEASSATFDRQSSDWTCPQNAGACSNTGVGQARWSWTNPLLQRGRYYVKVLGSAAGQTVGDVQVDGAGKLLVHGQRHPVTATVGSDGKFSVTIGKTDSSGTYSFKGVVLSVQPDAEYVELINLSDRAIDLTHWTIDGELTGGRQARFPSGSLIRPHALLVAAVDLDDQQAGLAGNGMSARAAWEIAKDANAVQLEFPNGPPSADDDWLKTTLPSGTVGRLTLRTQSGAVVDEVGYALPLRTTAPFQSLEKGDPSVITDADGNGVDDGWYPSLKLYTPGQPNDNEGLKQLVGLQTIVHDPLKEVTVLNRPLESVGELAGLPSGQAWTKLTASNLAKLADLLTVNGIRLEAEGHAVQTDGAAAWQEKQEGYFVHTDPKQASAAGRWQWTDVPNGAYRLSLHGCAECPGEQMTVRWQREDAGTFTAWSPPLLSDAQGRIVVGQLTVGAVSSGSVAADRDHTPAHTVTVELACTSTNGICHVDYVQLDPQLVRVGPVNINTAPMAVLLALPGMTQLQAARIVAGRPYGDQHGKGRGIGDVLLGDALGTDEDSKLIAFRRLAHLLTVRSDVFQIRSVGQGLHEDRITATQRIRAVIQR